MTDKKTMTFAEIQRKMQMGKKSKQGVSFSFRHVEDIATRFKELDSGWTLIFSDALEEVGGRLFLKATATIKNADQTETSTAFAEIDRVPLTKQGKNQMNVAQWTGAVSSYARKYAVQGLFAMGEDDVDGYVYEQETAPDTLTPDQIQELAKRVEHVARASGGDPRNIEQSLLQKLGAPTLDDIYAENFGFCVEYLEALLTKALQRSQSQQQPERPAGRQDFDINNI